MARLSVLTQFCTNKITSRHLAGLLATFLCLFGFQETHAYTVFLDEFTVIKNGNTLLADSFDDGLPPPSAPGGRQYIMTGSVGPETGGKLTMDSADAVCGLSAIGNHRCMQRAALQTNIDSTNLQNGLKVNDTFSVTGLFDLTAPTVQREKYGIRLSDQGGLEGIPPIGLNGNDIIELAVRRTASDQMAVWLRRIDVGTGDNNGTQTIYESLPLDLTLGDQIALTLSKDSAVSTAITASFAYVNSGIFGTPTVFSITPDIFNGENFTRAGFIATTPIPLPPAVWLFGSGLLGLIGISRRKKLA